MTEVSPVAVQQNIPVSVPQQPQAQVQQQPAANQPQTQTPEIAPQIVEKAAADAATSYAMAAINSQTPKV